MCILYYHGGHFRVFDMFEGGLADEAPIFSFEMIEPDLGHVRRAFPVPALRWSTKDLECNKNNIRIERSFLVQKIDFRS